MSVFDLFEEEVRKRLEEVGLDIGDVESYETRGNSLILHLKTGQDVKINDPYLVKLSEIKTNKEKIVYLLSEEALRARLYALENIFEGRMELKDFMKKYSSLDKRALIGKIQRIEEENWMYLSRFKEYLIALIESRLVEGGSYNPAGIYNILQGKTTQELAEIYMRISALEKITREDLEILLNIIK